MLRKYYANNKREALAILFFAVAFVAYLATHPRGPSTYVLTIWANQATIFALAAMAQFFAVVVRGLDLSVGAVMALANTLASHIVIGTSGEIAGGSLLVLGVAALCGLFNGLIIVYGRIQPIVATLATGAIYTGFALMLRPSPGGDIDADLADMMTYDIGGVPTALVLVVGLLLLLRLPMRRTCLGLSMYAVGSNENGALLSGVAVAKTKLVAYTLAGLFAGLAGSFLGFVTFSGDANIGPSYTLNTLAAVVLGGVLLRGGAGTLLGATIGAFILRTISALMFFSGLPPLAQPFFEGLILATAIAVGGADVLSMRNHLERLER